MIKIVFIYTRKEFPVKFYGVQKRSDISFSQKKIARVFLGIND